MKAVAYSSKICEKELLIKANNKKHDITLISNRLTADTISYAKGKDAVLVFSCDDLSAPILSKLKEMGVKYISTRSTGTDHIDIQEAGKLGLKVGNVPAYSPESIAEHAITLMLSLSKNIIPAHNQMLEYDFSLNNLVGNNIRNKTVGIVGLGRTGQAIAQILKGFGAKILVNDTEDKRDLCLTYGARQVSFEEILRESDIITFHVPLNDSTRHMVNAESIGKMKDGVMLINVSRGAIFNSKEVFDNLQTEKISKLGMDVYEFEHSIFFFNHSKNQVYDPLLKALIQHSRVLLTPHMAFLTEDALHVIAEKTISNLDLWESEQSLGDACCDTNPFEAIPKALSA
ncbi:NAD(P)-dependent oxidoreductase [Pedobacter sp. P351]|uniref:NAD(P)-dependent oxidoreductase n=1 Tax=Pedobacter superstes TaxID=3133441 RepID=UPI0030AA9A11